MSTRPLLFVLLCCFAFSAWAQTPVVHPGNSQHSLSRGQLRAIIGMRQRTWEDGAPIQVFVLPDRNPVHVAFCKKILGMFPHQLRSAWNRQVYSGTGQAPTRVGSVEEMRQRIATTPGAIGYLPEEKIDDTVQSINVE